MTDFPVITRIWDYGWLAGDELQVPAGSSDQRTIGHYVKSSAFHTSFLPTDKNETGIHGPFVAESITPSDFVPFERADLRDYLASLLSSSQWQSPATPEQFAAVERELQKPFGQGMRCYRLKLDETSSDAHHDWGFVLTVFREFLFLGHRPGFISRYVIGYD